MDYGTDIEVTLKIKLPKRANNEELLTWLKFSLNNSYLLSKKNPLAESDLEALEVDFRVVE